MALHLDPGRLGPVDELLRGYVDSGRLPFVGLQVAQHGEVRHTFWHGVADPTAPEPSPISAEAIVRIYSMTKPIVSLGLMQLVEQGRLLLHNPVSRWIPELADLRVWVGGTADETVTVAAERPITVAHLLSHTAGLTNGFFYGHPVNELYRRRALTDFFQRPDYDLAEEMGRIAEVPLLYQPGTRWSYSVATDVVARLIEVVSGVGLDDYLRTHVFEPLAMNDTGFFAEGDDRAARLVPNFIRDKGRKLKVMDPGGPSSYYASKPRLLSGTGGLVSTMADYQRFVDALAGGGQRDGVRILGTHTLAAMTSNHLPGGADLAAVGDEGYAEAVIPGCGFGLGFAVMSEPARSSWMAVPGDYFWGGAASTAFWVDPVNKVTVVFLTQLLPSSTYPIREQLRATVNAALVSA